MRVEALNKDEYLQYFQPYINQIGELNLIDSLIDGLTVALNFYRSIPQNKHTYRYAQGKWTIKEIINHLIDTERIFCYRALRFARNDKTVVSGFNENNYVAEGAANSRSFESLLEEYQAVRKATIILFQSFTTEMLLEKGKAGEGEVSVRALGFLIAGHEKHHYKVIKHHYLK